MLDPPQYEILKGAIFLPYITKTTQLSKTGKKTFVFVKIYYFEVFLCVF